jgi:hypothetical protein
VIGCREGNSITFDGFRRIGVFTTIIEVMDAGNAVRLLPKWGWQIARSRLFAKANFVVRENRLNVATDIVEGSAMISGLQNGSIGTDASLLLAVLLALWRAV